MFYKIHFMDSSKFVVYIQIEDISTQSQKLHKTREGDFQSSDDCPFYSLSLVK